MSKINLESLILEVLERELHESNNFLTAGEIAFRCNGVCYEKGIMRKSPIVPYSIKMRMAMVRERAFEKKLIITSKRMKHFDVKNSRGKKIQTKSLEVYGWKIADKNDKEYVIGDMDIRRLMSDGNKSSLNRLAEIAEKKGLITPDDIPKLLELNKD